MPAGNPEPMIVIHRIPFGDTSLVVHLFSPSRGRFAALAKGAFREKSPFFGALDGYDRIDAIVTKKRQDALGILISIQRSQPRRELRRDYARMIATFYTAELIDAALTETAHPRLFQIFDSFLDYLDTRELLTIREIRAAVAAFELHFLDELGLRPILHVCAECGSALDSPKITFDPSAGGALCQRCAPSRKTPWAISYKTLEAAAALLESGDLSEGREWAPLDDAGSRELRTFLDRFHVYHLDRTLKSRPALDFLWKQNRS
ncbi:MAG: DNA repair protein RecO [Planctomycetota bacterium]